MFPGPGAKGSIVTNDDVDVLMIFSLGTWTGYGIQSNHVSTIINPPKSRLGRFSKNLLMKVVIDLQYTTWLDPSTWWPAEISHTFFLLLRDWSAFFINGQKKTKHYSLGYRSLLITSSLNRSNGVWKLTIAMVSLIIVTHRNLCCTLTVSKYTHVLHIPRCTESIKKKTWSVIQDLELMNFTKKKKPEDQFTILRWDTLITSSIKLGTRTTFLRIEKFKTSDLFSSSNLSKLSWEEEEESWWYSNVIYLRPTSGCAITSQRIVTLSGGGGGSCFSLNQS